VAWPTTARLVSDAASFRRLRRLENYTTAWGEGELVELRLRGLDGTPVWVRPETSDRWVLHDVFLHRYHLPPPEITPDQARAILDLGSHIGLTIAHLAHRYPQARVVGVETDPESAALCRRNIAAFGSRCEIVEGAVWTSDGEAISYRRQRGELGSRVVQADGATDAEPAVARSVSINTLVGQLGPRAIDYVKMDIEGAEERVLRERTEWAERVRSIKVEVHPPYSVEDCRRDLARLGFRASADSRHWASATGIRAG
jgi:FkbM family methyltransferase